VSHLQLPRAFMACRCYGFRSTRHLLLAWGTRADASPRKHWAAVGCVPKLRTCDLSTAFWVSAYPRATADLGESRAQFVRSLNENRRRDRLFCRYRNPFNPPGRGPNAALATYEHADGPKAGLALSPKPRPRSPPPPIAYRWGLYHLQVLSGHFSRRRPLSRGVFQPKSVERGRFHEN